MKKSIALFMIVSLLMSMAVIPEKSLAEEKEEVNHTITCEWRDNNTTLVVKGQGRLADNEWTKQVKTLYPTLKKLVISEGITSIGAGYLDDDISEKIKCIVFPEGLKVLEEGVLGYFESNLKQVVFPNSLMSIEAGAIHSCYGLTTLRIPDSVTCIEKDSLVDCAYLKKLILPKSLKTYERTMTDCPSLKTVVNRSSLTIPLDNCKKKKTWYVNGKKKNKVSAGKTAKAKGKKYKIKYKLCGGKTKGKLPKSYRYGSDMKLPMKKVTKKGRYLIAWDVDKYTGDSSYFNFSFGPSTSGTVKVRPIWIKYTVKNVKGRKIKVYVSDKGACRRVKWGFVVRYSTKKDMSDAVYCPTDLFTENHNWGTGSSKYTLKKLKKRKKYYVQIAARFSEDLGPWMGKRCVKVKR